MLAGIDTTGGTATSRAGDVYLDATGTIRVEESSRIYNNVSAGATGNAGNVQIAGAVLQVTGGSLLSASTFGIGNAGNVVIRAGDRVLFQNGYTFSSVEAGGQGDGGNVEIYTSTLEVRDGAQLLANTESTGDAGNVLIRASDRVLFQGRSADKRFPSTASSSVDETGQGSGGNVEIHTSALEVHDGANLTSITRGIGNAGNVLIRADDRILFEDAYAFSRVEATGQGSGGNVEIYTSTLEVRNGAGLVASSEGIGDAGNVVIWADDRVLFQNGNAFSSVETRGQGDGGNIEIYTSTLEVRDGAGLVASSEGIGNAGNVVIWAGDRILFQGSTNDGQFVSAAFSSVQAGGQGTGGNVEIHTGTLEVRDGARLSSSTLGTGDAGNVMIQAGDRVLFQNGYALSGVAEKGQGDGGNVEIYTGILEVRDGSGLVALTGGTGDAGNVVIRANDRVLFQGTSADGRLFSGAVSSVTGGGRGTGGNVEIYTDTLEVRDGAVLTSSTLGTGNAGNVVIRAGDRVLFQNQGLAFSSVETGGLGRGGNVEIYTDTLEVRDGAQLSSSTRGEGDAGNVMIRAGDRVLFQNQGLAFSRVDETGQGRGGNIEIYTGTLEMRDGTQLIANTLGTGDAGDVVIRADDRVLLDGVDPASGRASGILTNNGQANGTISQGRGGNVVVTVPLLLVSNGAVIDASTANDKSGGNITLNLSQLNLLSGGQISTISQGSGSAGTLILSAADSIRISGSDPTYVDRLARNGTRVAPLSANSGIFVRSTNTGSAGNIILTTPRLTLDQQGRIDAQSATVSGGNLFLTVPNLLLLRNGGQISATAGTANPQAPGNGGNININARFIVANPKENSDITANATQGRGGNININSQGIFGLKLQPKLTPFSDITASSEVGLTGNVILNTPDNSAIQNNLSQLSSDNIDTSQLLAQTCLIRQDQPQGTFYITGTGGIPNRPSDLAPSTYATNTIQPTTQTAKRPWKLGDPIVEPHGFYKLSNGRLVMSRECK